MAGRGAASAPCISLFILASSFSISLSSITAGCCVSSLFSCEKGIIQFINNHTIFLKPEAPTLFFWLSDKLVTKLPQCFKKYLNLEVLIWHAFSQVIVKRNTCHCCSHCIFITLQNWGHQDFKSFGNDSKYIFTYTPCS